MQYLAVLAIASGTWSLASPPTQNATSLPSRVIADSTERIVRFVVDPKGQVIYVATDAGTVSAWDLDKSAWSWNSFMAKVAPDALAAGSRYVWSTISEPKLVFRIDTNTGKGGPSINPPIPTPQAKYVAADAKDRWVWLGADDGVLQRISPGSNDGWCDIELKNGGVRALALDGDGELLAVGGADKTIRFVDCLKARVDEKKRFDGHTAPIAALAYGLRNATLVSSAEDKLIRVWVVASGESKLELKGHAAVVRHLAVDARHSRLASGDENGTVKIWNLDKGAELASLTCAGPLGGLAFLDKGKSLAAASGTSVTVWDLSKL